LTPVLLVKRGISLTEDVDLRLHSVILAKLELGTTVLQYPHLTPVLLVKKEPLADANPHVLGNTHVLLVDSTFRVEVVFQYPPVIPVLLVKKEFLRDNALLSLTPVLLVNLDGLGFAFLHPPLAPVLMTTRKDCQTIGANDI
jgi:hypothetical protein